MAFSKRKGSRLSSAEQKKSGKKNRRKKNPASRPSATESGNAGSGCWHQFASQGISSYIQIWTKDDSRGLCEEDERDAWEVDVK